MTLIIHEVLSMILFYTCFCRAVKTDRSVKKNVLAAFWVLGASSCLSLFAPLAFGWNPDAVSLILLGGIVIVQVATSVLWRHGIPKGLINEGQC